MTERAGEVAWILDHLDDLDSDFSVFHHVSNFRALPAPTMFARAVRLPAYGGVMAVRAREWVEQDEPEALPPGAKEVSLDDPALAGLIEIGA